MNDLPVLSCDNCGACCVAMGHPQFYRTSDNADWNRLPEDLKREVSEHIDALTDLDIGSPCIWLDMKTKQCKHYDHRPQMCRDFEIGNPHCLRMRESYGLPTPTAE